ncbi:MAG: viroplasmin family protein [Oscillospiraceae bacterium]|jgi:viroplasmin and RNaseH domain-containing protein|nr:viroplasmin family protein [Oscillospiraceae bacterium]
MAKKQKFYAVKSGYKTGIFNDWNVCLDIGGYFVLIFKQVDSETLVDFEQNLYLY